MYFDINDKTNLLYEVDYDINYSYNCEVYQCDSICRCSTIDSVTVDFSKRNSFNFVNTFWKSDNDDLSAVLAERYLSRRINSNCFSHEACFGYYGQELESLNLTNRVPLDDFESFSDNTERLYEWLKIEYGKVLPEIFEVSSYWKLEKLEISKIKDLTGPKLNKNFLMQEYLQEYKKPGKSKTNQTVLGQRNWINKNHAKFFAPLCLPSDNGNYRLIDGRHRFFAYQQMWLKIPASYKTPVEYKTHKYTWAIVPEYE